MVPLAATADDDWGAFFVQGAGDDAVQALRRTVWVVALMSAADSTTVYGVERGIYDPDGNQTAFSATRPKLYDKYWKGQANPREESLSRAERALPGTRRWYDHPIWTLLRRQVWTLEDVHTCMEQIDPLVKSEMFRRYRGSAQRQRVRRKSRLSVGQGMRLVDQIALQIALAREASLYDAHGDMIQAVELAATKAQSVTLPADCHVALDFRSLVCDALAHITYYSTESEASRAVFRSLCLWRLQLRAVEVYFSRMWSTRKTDSDECLMALGW